MFITKEINKAKSFNRISLLFIFVLFSLVIVGNNTSAVICNPNIPNGCPTTTSATIVINDSEFNVNNTYYWDGHIWIEVSSWLYNMSDNLGNHIATQDLDMGGNSINNLWYIRDSSSPSNLLVMDTSTRSLYDEDEAQALSFSRIRGLFGNWYAYENFNVTKTTQTTNLLVTNSTRLKNVIMNNLTADNVCYSNGTGCKLTNLSSYYNKTEIDSNNASWSSTSNTTYNNLLNQNCPTGQVVNGTYSNGTFKCVSLTTMNYTNIAFTNQTNLFMASQVFGNNALINVSNISRTGGNANFSINGYNNTFITGNPTTMRFGIGTSNPQSTFQIGNNIYQKVQLSIVGVGYGDPIAAGSSAPSWTDGDKFFFLNDARAKTGIGAYGDNGLWVQSTAGLSATSFGLWNGVADGNPVERFTINGNGKVRINVVGTSGRATVAKNDLSILGSSSQSHFGSNAVSDQGISLINGINQVNKPYGIQFGGWNEFAHSGIFGVMTSDGGNTIGDIVFATRVIMTDNNLSEVMRIANNGNVSISKNLYVNNTISKTLNVTGYSYENHTTIKTLNVIGNSTINNFYGDLWFHNDTGVTASLNDTYQTLSVFSSASNGNKLNGFKNTTNGLQLIANSGSYDISWKAVGLGTQLHNYHGCLYINEVCQYSMNDHITGLASSEVRMSSEGIATINTGDNVTIRVRDVGSTSTGTIYIAQIKAVWVGN